MQNGLRLAINENSCMNIIDKITGTVSDCLSFIFWVAAALVCAGILALLS